MVRMEEGDPEAPRSSQVTTEGLYHAGHKKWKSMFKKYAFRNGYTEQQYKKVRTNRLPNYLLAIKIDDLAKELENYTYKYIRFRNLENLEHATGVWETGVPATSRGETWWPEGIAPWIVKKPNMLSLLNNQVLRIVRGGQKDEQTVIMDFRKLRVNQQEMCKLLPLRENWPHLKSDDTHHQNSYTTQNVPADPNWLNTFTTKFEITDNTGDLEIGKYYMFGASSDEVTSNDHKQVWGDPNTWGRAGPGPIGNNPFAPHDADPNGDVEFFKIINIQPQQYVELEKEVYITDIDITMKIPYLVGYEPLDELRNTSEDDLPDLPMLQEEDFEEYEQDGLVKTRWIVTVERRAGVLSSSSARSLRSINSEGQVHITSVSDDGDICYLDTNEWVETFEVWGSAENTLTPRGGPVYIEHWRRGEFGMYRVSEYKRIITNPLSVSATAISARAYGIYINRNPDDWEVGDIIKNPVLRGRSEVIGRHYLGTRIYSTSWVDDDEMTNDGYVVVEVPPSIYNSIIGNKSYSGAAANIGDLGPQVVNPYSVVDSNAHAHQEYQSPSKQNHLRKLNIPSIKSKKRFYYVSTTTSETTSEIPSSLL